MIKRVVCIFFISLLSCKTGFAQSLLPYKDSRLPVDERVKDLLARMTPEEKFWQLFMIPGDDSSKYKNGIFGLQLNTDTKNQAAENVPALRKKINSIQKYFIGQTRLGIPVIFFDEALHGLVRDGATVFPQSIALAATWDTALMHNVSKAIADEARLCGIRDVLSPVINIASDVRWGRTEETYGEDPFLTTEMAVAYVSEFEKAGVITTPKHFIANVGDGGRDSYPIHFNERLLNEIYFPPFKACIERGGSRSIMTSYNSLDGTPCSANDWLLNKTLKDKWGFKGFVISDAGATGGANVLHYTSPDYPTSGKLAINSGLDVIFQTSFDHSKLFIPHFLDGSIEQKRIDDAVSRVLKAKFELGLFEHPYIDEMDGQQRMKDQQHKEIATQAARESMVLLKNEKNRLPLDKNIHAIAVIGLDAKEARLGGYSGEGNNKVSILSGIQQKAGSNTKVLYAEGCGRENTEYVVVPDSCLVTNKNENGLKGEYFNTITLTGNSAVTRVDKNIDFSWTLSSPDPKINLDFYSARWTGKIHSPKTGRFKIGLEGNDGFRLYINDTLLVDNWKKQTYSTILSDFYFEREKNYNIRVEFFEPVGNAHIKLVWNVGVSNLWLRQIQETISAVQQADVAVVVVGINEGEFRDRAMLTLPGNQEGMIKEIASVGKPVVVVLVGGSAVVMNNWLADVSSVIDVWYPGEAGGTAVADVLFGDYNPAGRLPITFPMNEAQLPLVYNHKPTGRGDDYNNLSGLPLFPFGFGLSYTRFEYSSLTCEKNNISTTDSTVVRFKIKNTGNREGDEVVQLYIHDELASVARPVMELKGFQRVHLAAGETKEISFAITPTLLSMLNEKMETVVEPGDFRIMIGGSSSDIRLKETLSVKK